MKQNKGHLPQLYLAGIFVTPASDNIDILKYLLNIQITLLLFFN
jgi:hypothetical protein